MTKTLRADSVQTSRLVYKFLKNMYSFSALVKKMKWHNAVVFMELHVICIYAIRITKVCRCQHIQW